jgi:hypothetical protein
MKAMKAMKAMRRAVAAKARAAAAPKPKAKKAKPKAKAKAKPKAKARAKMKATKAMRRPAAPCVASHRVLAATLPGGGSIMGVLMSERYGFRCGDPVCDCAPQDSWYGGGDAMQLQNEFRAASWPELASELEEVARR